MTNLTTSNSKADLPDFVHIFRVENFDYYKPKLLQSVSDTIIKNDIQLNEQGYYYDYNIPETERPYDGLFREALKPSMEAMEEMYALNFAGHKSTAWFQQYEQGSEFGWHQHDGQWAVVLYLELPEKMESTEFLSYGHFDVQEGDVIYFPTFLVHRAPKITSSKRKTILARNISGEVNRKLIKLYGEQHFKH